MIIVLAAVGWLVFDWLTTGLMIVVVVLSAVDLCVSYIWWLKDGGRKESKAD